jgi:hypothetical protein
VKESSVLFGHRPRTINRAALIVRPRQPYVDWANSVDDDGPRAILQELRTDPSIYLVESIDSLEDLDLLVEDNWEWIFREQLNGWMRDPEFWPAELTREMFLEWFECELSTMIWDMLKTRIKPAN